MDNFEINGAQKENVSPLIQIESDDGAAISSSRSNGSENNNMEVIFLGQNSTNNNLHSQANNCSTSSSTNSSSVSGCSNKFNSCKTLQQKLELKVERAKKNYSHQHSSQQQSSLKEAKMGNSSLIPINRLSIPGYHENVPLVEYKSEHSGDEEEISSPFFPSKPRLRGKKLDLSDTFSIQEMTIESDVDSDDESGDSENLELLPPSVRIQFLDKLINYFCCSTTEP